MKSPKLVVGLGEILWDIFESRKTLGGAPANFAYHASRAGAEGMAISAIGRDALGDAVVALLAEKQLPALLQRNDRDTGTVRVSLDAGGSARYVFPPDVAWDNLTFTDELRRVALTCDAAAFGTLAQRSEMSRNTIRAFLNAMPPEALRVFDVNLRQHFYSEALVRESLALADVLKINESELAVLAGYFLPKTDGDFHAQKDAFFETVFTAFPRLCYIVLSCGAEGSFAATRDGERSFVPADKTIRVVDTVGAGDAFTAAFTVAVLDGKSLYEAHRLAAARAGFVCSRAGAMP